MKKTIYLAASCILLLDCTKNGIDSRLIGFRYNNENDVETLMIPDEGGSEVTGMRDTPGGYSPNKTVGHEHVFSYYKDAYESCKRQMNCSGNIFQTARQEVYDRNNETCQNIAKTAAMDGYTSEKCQYRDYPV